MGNPVKIKAVVREIVSHGEGVYTLQLKPEKRAPRFIPGQFLHLTIDDFDPHGGFWPQSRVFSIASHPSQELITIVYSVKGHYTTRMSTELTVHKEVWLKLPYGNFCINDSLGSEQDILLIAGGTGISPYIPYLEQIGQQKPAHAVSLVYGIRRQEHLLFDGTLARCLDWPGFNAGLFLEEGVFNHTLSKSRMDLQSGKISLDYILQKQRGLNNPYIFLSGPPAMITLFKEGLVTHGVPSERIRIDEW